MHEWEGNEKRRTEKGKKNGNGRRWKKTEKEKNTDMKEKRDEIMDGNHLTKQNEKNGESETRT